jgi:flagellum-specific peptidoglycan hydrolase FlgJ
MKKNNKYIIATIIGFFIFLKWKQKKQPDIILPTLPLNTSNDYRKNFVDLIKQDCIDIGKKIGVPYKFIIAQLILETGWGRSSLFTKYNNIGGIKAVAGQKFVTLPTNEYLNNRNVRLNQNFAVYDTKKQGIEAYERVLQNKYFAKYLNKTSDPLEYAKLLQGGKPKYATDPKYVSKIESLLKTIETLL